MPEKKNFVRNFAFLAGELYIKICNTLKNANFTGDAVVGSLEVEITVFII